jgi:two-component system response regulator NreC
MHDAPDRVAEAIAEGANGFAIKSQPTQEIVEAFQRVASGEAYLAPSVAARGVPDGEARPGASPVEMLSPREREVFDLLVRGHTNRSIARELFVSVKTVETHRSHIFRKLQVHSICELVRLAARRRLIVED